MFSTSFSPIFSPFIFFFFLLHYTVGILAELYTLRPLFPGSSEADEIYKICSILGKMSVHTSLTDTQTHSLIQFSLLCISFLLSSPYRTLSYPILLYATLPYYPTLPHPLLPPKSTPLLFRPSQSLYPPHPPLSLIVTLHPPHSLWLFPSFPTLISSNMTLTLQDPRPCEPGRTEWDWPAKCNLGSNLPTLHAIVLLFIMFVCY